MNQAAAAKIGGIDHQTLRDSDHRFNALGPEGLVEAGPKVPSLACQEEQ